MSVSVPPRPLPASVSRPGDLTSQAPALVVFVLAALIAVSPISTKLAGLSLFVLLAWGLWVRLRRPAVLSLQPLVRDWAWIVVGVLVLQGAATWMWHDSWGSRHFEVRLALSGLVLWLLMPRVALSEANKVWVMHGMAAACWAALGLTWLHGRDTPTNPIPWAAGLSFLVCVLLARCLNAAHGSPGARAFWLVSSVAGVGGVILSQSRGSFSLLPWWLLMLVLALWLASRGRQASSRLWWGALGGLVLVTSVVALVPRLYQEPLGRVQEARHELGNLVEAIQNNKVSPQVLDTSVGARAYLYLHGWTAIQASPLAGYGEQKRKAWVKELGRSSGSEVILSLDHLHNDPLSLWFDHGLLGLLSYVLSVAGLLWLAWGARVHGLGMSMGFAGLAWMHFSSGLTNMNTGHNYYGVMLSLSVVLVFLFQPRAPTSAVS